MDSLKEAELAGLGYIGAAPGILAVAKPAGLLGFGLFGVSGFRGGLGGSGPGFVQNLKPTKPLLVVDR